jgi:hypothetical protein
MNTAITITLAQFLIDFQEFATLSDPAQANFPPSTFTYYFNLAQLLIDPTGRVTDWVNQLAELFIAHHIALEMLATNDMNAGGVPGIAKGAIAGKSAGDVSIAYAPQATMEIDAGHWNYTIYGQRFIRLAKMAGMGPVQVNAPGWCGGPWNGPAWPGPWNGGW